VRPTEHLHEWLQLDRPQKTERRRLSRVAITYHPWYQGFRVREVVNCLEEIAALGAGYLRSDVRWCDVVPNKDTPDEAAIEWYRNYFIVARDVYQLRPIIVLSEPPKWFRQLERSDALASWRSYVEYVMHRLGDLCDVYQVFNEPNNRIYRIFPDEQTGVALSAAAQIIRGFKAQAAVVINLSLDLPNWQSELIKFANHRSSIDLVTFDLYPGTWSLNRWAKLSQLRRVISVAKDLGLEASLKRQSIGIMETGYATNVPLFRTELHQKAYFEKLGQICRELDHALGPTGLAILGIYELCDAESKALLDPEAHFGLLTSSLSRKNSFYLVRELCSLFVEPES
jgi:hypothetical protein